MYSNNYDGEYNSVSSLQGCLEDLLSYWKNEVIPYNIMFKEEVLKRLKSKIAPKMKK